MVGVEAGVEDYISYDLLLERKHARPFIPPWIIQICYNQMNLAETSFSTVKAG